MGIADELGVAADAGSVRARFLAVRRRTEALAAPLGPEDQMVQSCVEASPTKWHLAHTSWFFETMVLAPHDPAFTPFDRRYSTLFNSYYDDLGQGRLDRRARGLLSRPTLDEIARYRASVDERLVSLLERGDKLAAIAPLLALGLAHEEQHQELLLTDIKHAFAANPLRPAYAGATQPAAAEPGALAWHNAPGGLAAVGHGDHGFSFDVERPRHRVVLSPFTIACRLVTNGEYLGFIQDGGYRRPSLWLADGWDLACAQRWQAPLYWEERDRSWWQFTLRGPRPLGLAEPVSHVSYFEADAYARWAGARLPTEDEWESVAGQVPLDGNFVESGALGPRPAAAPRGARPTQLFGDAWEWTSSAFGPYPGFRPAPGPLGQYNGKFMCGQFVLRGGSCLTPRAHMRASYRNFFPPGARWQATGIRLARDGAC